MPNPADELVGTVEACQILGVNRSTLSRWSDERFQPSDRRISAAMRLPGKRGAVLFNRSEVHRLAEELQAETRRSSAVSA